MQKCPKCNENYDSQFFHNSKSRKTCKALYCKRCERKRVDELRAGNKQKFLEFLKTQACIDCGNNNPIVLELDRREKKAARKYSIGVMLQDRVSWKRVQEEIAKCDVRCANCHRIKTSMEHNSYRTLSSDKLPGY